MNSAKKLLLAAVCLLPLARQTAHAQSTSIDPVVPEIRLVQQTDPAPTAAGLFQPSNPEQSRVPNMLSSYLGPSIRVDQPFVTTRTVTNTRTVTTPRTVTVTVRTLRLDTFVNIQKTVTVNGVSTVTDTSILRQTQVKSYRVPEASRGFRISDNESPDTQTRVLFNFN